MSVLRAGSYNILHGMRVLGGSDERDPEALSQSVAQLDVDVLGIQEVDAGQPRSGMVDQTAQSAAALGAAHWRFIPTVVGTPGPAASFRPATDADIEQTRRAGHEEPLYGVGLISRIPVLQWRHLLMDPAKVSMPLLIPGDPKPRMLRVPDEPRAAIAAVLDLPTPVTVVTAHLSFVPVFNVKQLRRIKDWVADLPRPLVLLGDLNLPGRIPAMVTGWHAAELGATYPVFKPRVQFDHILSDGFAARQAQVHALPVSDHCAVTAEFGL
jgi:endonuclease/exonuclease/phosphatase family metal-dependent hydrolase